MLDEMINMLEKNKKNLSAQDFRDTQIKIICGLLSDDEKSDDYAAALLNLILACDIDIARNISVNILTHKVYFNGDPVEMPASYETVIEEFADTGKIESAKIIVRMFLPSEVRVD